MSTWRYRPALVFSMVVGSLATIVDLIIVMRWNVAMGIPDKLFFLLGNATFEQLTNILHAIPMSAISAKIAPPGMESAVFGKSSLLIDICIQAKCFTDSIVNIFLFWSAYSVGIGTFCFMVSNLLGACIIEWSGMKTVGEDCNFDKLPSLIVIFQIVIPLLVGIPACFLIPNVLQTERLIDYEKEPFYEHEIKEEDQTFDSDEEAMNGEEAVDLRVQPLVHFV